MSFPNLTYYENKSLVRLKGVAKCMGFQILSASWDAASHTVTLEFGAPQARCQEFIDGASKAIRKARYAHVTGGVTITFAETMAAARTLRGTQPSA